MGYEELWKALADLLAELQRKNTVIPTDIMKDLRSANTMIQIFKVDPTNTENLLRIETYIGNVESYLFFLAQDTLNPERVEHWMKKFEEARRKAYKKKAVSTTLRVITGIPRGKRWIRIQVSEEMIKEDLEKLASMSGLSFRMQENGYMLVYGDSENVKSFIKKIKEKEVKGLVK